MKEKVIYKKEVSCCYNCPNQSMYGTLVTKPTTLFNGVRINVLKCEAFDDKEIEDIYVLPEWCPLREGSDDNEGQ